MLETYLLEELVTFAEAGTLAATAAKLNVTQPTITRGMQKLETDLGVSLFDRQPNRLSLTATGQLAAQQAQQLLADQDQFVTSIQNFDRTQRTITVGTTIPGPLYLLPLVSDKFSLTINNELVTPADVTTKLSSNAETLLLTATPLQTATIDSQLIGTERLAVNLNKFMYQANQPQITFKELAGLSFIVLSKIGPWREIIQQAIPDAKFFYQKEFDALAEITKYADFPYFSTNLSTFETDFNSQVMTDDSRVAIPISDANAQMSTYAVYLKTQRARVKPLITALIDKWPTK